MSKTTLLIETETREKLKQFGFKGQTYDDVIKTLLDSKKQGPQEANGEQRKAITNFGSKGHGRNQPQGKGRGPTSKAI